MRGKSIICVLMVLALLVSLAMVNVSYGADPPKVYVDPATAFSSPTGYVEVKVNVTDSPEILGFQFKLRWDKSILGFPPADCNVTEGTFVSSAGSTAFTVLPNTLEANVHVGCHLTSTVASPPSGNGTLAIFRFYVLESGVTNLTLSGVELYDYTTGGKVSGVTTQNGYFYTPKPFVDFYWTPVSPEVNEVATFNASACWDPDGGNITQYSWNFGDGNITVIGDDEPITPIITHKYPSYNESGWQVTLTVTDDESDTWSKTRTLRMWHELVAVNIWNAVALMQYDWWFMDTVDRKIIRGEYVWILGTVVNLGTYVDTTNATLNARHVATDTTVDLECAWGGGPVVEYTLGTGTAGGSGWDIMFEWYTDDALPGIWELTLAATPVSGEVDTANNVMSLTVEILPYGELSESLNELVSRTLGLHGRISIQDIVIAANAFGSRPGDSNWNPLADFNNNGVITIVDLVTIARPGTFGLEW